LQSHVLQQNGRESGKDAIKGDLSRFTIEQTLGIWVSTK
jgi:hypothetical protein